MKRKAEIKNEIADTDIEEMLDELVTIKSFPVSSCSQISNTLLVHTRHGVVRQVIISPVIS
jgi:hypothetical protein